MHRETGYFKAIPPIIVRTSDTPYALGPEAQIRIVERSEKGQSRHQIALHTRLPVGVIDDVLAVFQARHAAAGWGARK